MTAPLLVFGWGNPSRGDDAIGPLLVQRLAARLDAAARAQVELLEDYQLQVEHALDLVGRRAVLFVDASRALDAPFRAGPVPAAGAAGVSTHALSPGALLQVYRQVQGGTPPPCTLLAVRGQGFELGAPLSAGGAEALVQALEWATGWVADGLRQGQPAA